MPITALKKKRTQLGNIMMNTFNMSVDNRTCSIQNNKSITDLLNIESMINKCVNKTNQLANKIYEMKSNTKRLKEHVAELRSEITQSITIADTMENVQRKSRNTTSAKTT